MEPRKPNRAAGGVLGGYVLAGGKAGNGPYSGTSRLTTNRNTDWRNFGPRLGLAWKPIDRLVIRSAYGISYYPDGGLGGGNVQYVTDGYSASANFISNNGITPAFAWANGYPQNYRHPPFIDPGLNDGQNDNMGWHNGSKRLYKQDCN